LCAPSPADRTLTPWSEVLSPRAKLPPEWNRLLGKRLIQIAVAASVSALPQELTAIHKRQR
jgi:hypothetical protein